MQVTNATKKQISIISVAPRKEGNVQAMASLSRVKIPPGETLDVASDSLDAPGVKEMIASGMLVVEERRPRKRQAESKSEGAE